MAPQKEVIESDGTRIPAAEDAILYLLGDKYPKSLRDTKILWNKLKEGPLKSMRDDKGLIKLLKGKEKQISRMWEIAACRYSQIAHLMAPEDNNLEALHAKTLKAPDDKAAKDRYAVAVRPHADPVVDAMLPQEGESVKFIVKRGGIKGGRDTLRFPWERSSKGFKEEFEMTISNGNNAYSVRIGDIGGENSNEHHAVDIGGDLLLSVERNPDRLPLPHAVTSPGTPKSCVVTFTFGVPQDQIIVYIRFAGPTMLVGRAFKANLWRDLVLAKY